MGKTRRQTEALPVVKLVSGGQRTGLQNASVARGKSEVVIPNVAKTKIPERPIKTDVERTRLTMAKQPIKPTVDLFGQLQRDMLNTVGYTYNLIERYPKGQKLYVGVANTIVSMTGECLEMVHKVCAYNPKLDKEQLLRDMSCKLKTIEDHVEISCRKRYISIRNRDAWIKQLIHIDDTVIGIAMWLEKQAKEKRAHRDGAAAN